MTEYSNIKIYKGKESVCEAEEEMELQHTQTDEGKAYRSFDDHC